MHKRILPRLIIDLLRQKSPFFEGLRGLPIDSVPTIVLPQSKVFPYLFDNTLNR